MKLGRKILCFLFGCIIGLPLILEIVFNTMDINLDIALKGHFDTYIKPHFELESFISRDYQTDYEKWLNANLKPRGMFIKLYNQIQYSFFDLGNRVIGKEGDIFEESYIDDYLRDKDEYNFSLKNNQIAIEEYVQQLQSIDKRLKEINKHLILYTTPTKLDVSYKNLPYKYKIRQNSNAIRGIDYLKTLLEKTDIIYVDTGELLYDQQQYPSFYKTGIHWSRPLEQKATALIIDMMREISGKEIRNVTLGELKKNNEPFWRDTDVFDLLNIYSENNEKEFFEYVVEREYPQIYDSAKVLLQGGSFAMGVQHDFFDIYPNEELTYINYDNYVIDSDGNMIKLNTWEDLELGLYLDEVDFVIIELNEAVINQYSSGFVAYLDEFLEEYIPGSKSKRKVGMNMSIVSSDLLQFSKGFYGFEGGENGFSWMGESAIIKLQNENISQKGLQIKLAVPDELPENNIYIYINGKLVEQIACKKSGFLDLNINPERFGRDNDNRYTIEIFAEKSFNPKERSMSGDSRDLSLRVYYIGEEQEYGI